MSPIQPFQFHTTPTIVFAEGTASQLAVYSAKLTVDRWLFVTDPGLRKLGLCDPALASLAAVSCAQVTIFDEVEADPSLATLEAAVATGRAAGVAGVIGFGGGSSLDVAKLAALLLGSGEVLDEAWGVGNATGPRLPLILVPTTAGTGSEVTPVSIITVGSNEKRGVSSPLILPDIAVLDPALTHGLPSAITAATGIDAMVHAIEAYASKNANNNPLSKMLAIEALKLLGGNIERAVFEGADGGARASMLLGSMLAGQAYANSPVAAVHALAYPVGGMFHVPHGLSNALVLPHVLRFNIGGPETDAAAQYAALAPHLFADWQDKGSTHANASAFIDHLAGLSRRLGLETRLRQVGVSENDLPVMAREAMEQQRLLVNNPRAVSEADALAIYRAAW